jgi:LPXTG-motif cell wall-anchored protein
VPRRRLTALLAALVLAAPASAFAQSAGDDQYQDPFGSGGDQQHSQGGGGGGTTGSSGESAPAPVPTAAPAPAAPAPATAAPAPAAVTASTTTASAAAPQLPRTGEDAGLLALGGAILLAGGVALRVRVRRADRA